MNYHNCFMNKEQAYCQNGYHQYINDKKVLAKMWRKGNPRALLVGMQTGEATVENNMEFPQKTKNGTAL